MILSLKTRHPAQSSVNKHHKSLGQLWRFSLLH
jgi:hypothetical protein